MGHAVVKSSWMHCAALLVFQCSVMLAQIGVMQRIAQDLQTLLWQGGKTDTKKYHLVIWSVVRGLSIRDPTLLNLAWGGKLSSY